MNWSAAILAGGRARRLGGQDKSALILDGIRFIERQRDALQPLTNRIVLVGYRGAAPAPLPVEHDRWPDAGPLGGLATALLTATTDRVLVLACDLPCVTTQFLAFLANVDSDAIAVVPVCDDRWQPLCAMYARRAAGTFVAALARGDRAVAAVVSELRPRLIGRDEWAPFDPTGVLLANVNTPEDLARVRSHETGARMTTRDAVNAGDGSAGSVASQTNQEL
jgi:molybdopterin-guanine dinucleotide biosynthesis protein A